MMQAALIALIQSSLQALQRQRVLKVLPEAIQLAPTRDPSHGDFATNTALLLAKTIQQPPRQLAEQIVAAMPASELIDKIEIAGPGFINFFLKLDVFQQHLKTVLDQGDRYGCGDSGAGKRIHLEFVSANPTGPLHVGHGRAAALGSSIANLLKSQGFAVHREYYVNDAGRQMHILAVSIWVRYLQLHNIDIPVPAAGYQGDYVIAIAKTLQAEYADLYCFSQTEILADLPADGSAKTDKRVQDDYVDALIKRAQTLLNSAYYQQIFAAGLDAILMDIRTDLAEFGVEFDHWFHESTLVKDNIIERSVGQLQAIDVLYEQDGAVWFRATDFGDEKDRVLIRANGNPTYFAADTGYHLHKYQQGYTEMIDILGADHHGYVPRIRAFLQALNQDPDKLKVLIVQFVSLFRGKTKVQMSTRSGQFVTLRALRNEVGNDAARFFYLMRKNDQHLDFDLELAKSQERSNPVYYLQYAHARICNVFQKLKTTTLTWTAADGLRALTGLTTPHEQTLLKYLPQYVEVTTQAALKYQPHLLCHYLQTLSQYLHSYYDTTKVLVEDDELRQARLCLLLAVKQVLQNGLTLLGLSAPEKM